MELVRGIPITDYCSAEITGLSGWTVRQVCHSVQHAHQKVSSTRLKPSNILVTEHDGRAIPKVIDFSVAK
jgi:serine/threonine protein kinase